jgi:hypothetical protein
MFLVNFNAGPNRLLSYVGEITSITTADAVINIKPDVPDAGFAYLVFTIIVIT